MTYTADKTAPIVNTRSQQRVFKVYIFYRLVMVMLLTVLFLSGLGENIVGTHNPDAFIFTSGGYLIVCFFTVLFYLSGKLKIDTSRLLLLLAVDFTALVVLIHSSNSAINGLGYLLLIPMAVGSTFFNGKTSLALAAFASLLVISSSILHWLSDNHSNQTIFTSGIAGIVLFATAVSFRLLSKKIQYSDHKIQQQADHTQYLQQLNQHIIETIQAGIIVINNKLDILIINHAAKKLLFDKQTEPSLQRIDDVYHLLLKWQQTNRIPEATIVNTGVNNTIKLYFSALPSPKMTSLMLFIEDEKRLAQEAQQLKLASLGRLTSSIAHEIRNPLGAISHASQLLDESEFIHDSDQTLLGMIQANSQRISQTIDNVLQFSRRREAYPEMVNINRWLHHFCQGYQSHTNENIILTLPDNSVFCEIDPNHLQQIMNNLVDNGLRHSQQQGVDNTITIEVYIDPVTACPCINIIDEGEGIPASNIEFVFDPFYTTKPTGSGLGLYLCKELCQANKANLVYINKTSKQKSCFKLILAIH